MADQARNPDPPDGATDILLNVTLGWQPWEEADEQHVYFGTDYQAVLDADEDSPEYKDTLGWRENSYEPGPLKSCTTYYWRIDTCVLVVEQVEIPVVDGPPIIIEEEYEDCDTGPVWSFTTGPAEPNKPRLTAGAISVKINLYDGLKVDPNNVGKDPNAVDPNAVIQAVNRNFRANDFNYRLVIKEIDTVDPNDGGHNYHGGDNGEDLAQEGDGRIRDTERRQDNPADPNDPNNGTYLGSDPDSEWRRTMRYGRDEAVKQGKQGHQNQNFRDPNNWDCIKISLVKAFVDETDWFDPNGNYIESTWYTSDNPGTTIHRWPVIIAAVEGVRAVIVDHNDRAPGSDSYRPGDPNDPNIFNERMAETVKHEIGHVLTLTRGHQIGPDPNDPNQRANENGHAPETPHDPNDPNAQANDPNGSGNFMAPSTWRHNSIMTKPQKDEMEKMAKKLARTVSQNESNKPAQKVKQQAGSTSDKNKDLSEPSLSLPSIYDLGLIHLHGLYSTDNSCGDTHNIEAIIIVDGVLPSEEFIQAQYTLGFDIDANQGTGITHGDREGIDRIVYITAEGVISDGTFDLRGLVHDTVSDTSEALPEPPDFEIEDKFVDIDAESTPVATSFMLEIPKSMLNFTANSIPVVATSSQDGTSIYDTAELHYDRFLWVEYPTLELFGDAVPTPGQEYPFAISGLQPSSQYELRLQDRVVHTGVLDPNGSDSDSFIFPYDVPIMRLNFIIAQDITGEFAFNVTSACSTCECEVEIDERDNENAEWEYRGAPGLVEYEFTWDKKDVVSVKKAKDDLGRDCIIVEFKNGKQRRYRCTNSESCKPEVTIEEYDDCWKGTVSCWEVH